MGNFNTNLNLGSISQLGVQPQLTPIQQPHQPSLFRRVLGSVAGIAGNMFAPGLGGALGSLIGGSGALGSRIGGSNVSGTAQFNSMIANAQASTAQSTAEANQLLQVAQEANREQEEVEMMSNLEKSKHAAAMSVIQNIGS